jgi:hypothetical protein
VDCGTGVCVFFTGAELIKAAAEIRKRTFGPVEFIVDLHFQIDKSIVIHPDIDIKDEVFVINGFAKLDGIRDFERFDSVQIEMKQRTNQLF